MFVYNFALFIRGNIMYREYKRCAFSVKKLSPVVGFPVALYRYLKPKSYTRCQFFTSFMPLQWRSIALLNKVFVPSRFVVLLSISMWHSRGTLSYDSE